MKVKPAWCVGMTPLALCLGERRFGQRSGEGVAADLDVAAFVRRVERLRLHHVGAGAGDELADVRRQPHLVPVRALWLARRRRGDLVEQQIHLAVLHAVEPGQRRFLRGVGPELEIAGDRGGRVRRVQVKVMKHRRREGAPAGACVVATTAPRAETATSETQAEETNRVVFIADTPSGH